MVCYMNYYMAKGFSSAAAVLPVHHRAGAILLSDEL